LKRDVSVPTRDEWYAIADKCRDHVNVKLVDLAGIEE
jgi:hypothetical protein